MVQNLHSLMKDTHQTNDNFNGVKRLENPPYYQSHIVLTGVCIHNSNSTRN